MSALSSSGDGSLTRRRSHSRPRTRRACGRRPGRVRGLAPAPLACRTGTRSASSRATPTMRERPPVSHCQVLGEARKEHIPPLVTNGSRHLSEQPLTLPGRFQVVLLQELHDQPPPRTSKSGSAAYGKRSRVPLARRCLVGACGSSAWTRRTPMSCGLVMRCWWRRMRWTTRRRSRQCRSRCSAPT